jgi:hypothetical protein
MPASMRLYCNFFHIDANSGLRGQLQPLFAFKKSSGRNMALARIITRSQACSRELALDLLARGYAVEIVSPDNLPDNFADLELRVETSPGDRLIANVEAHDGKRTTSLEFVHHLKAPMVPFKRRAPEPAESVHASHEPVSFNAAPGIDDTEPRAEAPQLPPKAVSPTPGILLNHEHSPEIDREEGERPIAPQILPPPPVEPPRQLAVEDTTAPRPTFPTPTVQPGEHSAGWPWGAALTFAAVVLLAVILGFGMWRPSKPASQSFAALPVQKEWAPTGVSQLSVTGAEKDRAQQRGQFTTVPSPPHSLHSKENSIPTSQEAQLARVEAPTASPGASVSRQLGEDLIAHDTVTYLDKRFEPVPKAKPAKTGSVTSLRSHTPHDGGIIAADTVTYVNKPAPKAAK